MNIFTGDFIKVIGGFLVFIFFLFVIALFKYKFDFKKIKKDIKPFKLIYIISLIASMIFLYSSYCIIENGSNIDFNISDGLINFFKQQQSDIQSIMVLFIISIILIVSCLISMNIISKKVSLKEQKRI